LRGLQEKQEQVIASIDEQGKLTEALRQQILAATTLARVDDLYRPYRPKRRTRATIAIERGLEPLADILLAQRGQEPIVAIAEKYIDADEVPTAEDALAGAKDILAERLSDDPDFRSYIRDITFTKGIISSTASDKEQKSVYEQYYDFEEAASKIAGHRILAMNRGEKEDVLKVKILAPKEDIPRYLARKVITNERADTAPLLTEMIEDSYMRLIAPSVEREIRAERTEFAETGAIRVFGQNLTQLLLQPPITGRVVLGWDPAFRTGCKLAVVDETGKVLDTAVVYPTAPTTPAKIQDAKDTVKALIQKYGVTLISLGNGTASRESEPIIAGIVRELGEADSAGAAVQYVIVNEAGASVYSASKLASEEFPQFDVGQRSAASIARRLQDPLAELVKIDPKSIGVGQYQHDMNQKKLGESLAGVVET
jgi:uncharacterized protein